MTASELVKRIRHLDAEMTANLERTGDLAAARREAIAQLVEIIGNVERTADRLGISKGAVYKALREETR